MISGLNDYDIRLLTRSFVKSLNEIVNGDEEKCVDSIDVFKMNIKS